MTNPTHRPSGAKHGFRSILFSALAVALASAAGCSSPQCELDRDCPAGQVCDANGTCVAQSGCGTCSGTTPVCDTAQNKCVTCTSTEGCAQGRICDTSVAGGKCVQCRTADDCSGATPLCDTAAGKCVTCTATEGCGTGKVCDTSITGGACVGCLENDDCADAAKPVCDTVTRTCVKCTATNKGVCTAAQTCDTSVSGGRCVECLDSDACTDVARPACDVPSGLCVVCLADGEGCEDDEICTIEGATRTCEPPPECDSSTECPTSAPVCDTAAGACVVCTETAGCSGATPVCDTSEGLGECVGCLENGDCGGTTPKCLVAQTTCVECLQNSDCSTNSCSADHTCVNPGSLQIQAILDLADGTTEDAATDLAVENVTVTYVRPLVSGANATIDPAGFFVQAQKAGPAMFVVKPDSMTDGLPVAGDKISFHATLVGEVGNIRSAKTFSNFVRTAGTPAAAAAMAQDVSAATDLVTALGSYESRLLKIDAEIAGSFLYSGGGFVAANLLTDGVTEASSDLVLRVPTALPGELELVSGCEITATGPMWRYAARAQAMAFAAGDIVVANCPAPRLVAAHATTATEVTLVFDRKIQTAVAGDFTIAPSLAVSAVAVAGYEVKLTTATQAGSTYTVTAGTGVKDFAGASVDAAHKTATFVGFVAACQPSDVVISQVYGGGGASSSGPPFKTDYIELHNRGSIPVVLDGWSLQYASATGTSWNVAPLSGTIAAGGYFLISCGSVGTAGVDLAPTPDLGHDVCGLSMSATAGKAALVKNTTPLSGCPAAGAAVVSDLVAWGSSTACKEGSGNPLSLANTKAVVRKAAGCTDAGDNNTDFELKTVLASGTPDPATQTQPRNSENAAEPCTCP